MILPARFALTYPNNMTNTPLYFHLNRGTVFLNRRTVYARQIQRPHRTSVERNFEVSSLASNCKRPGQASCKFPKDHEYYLLGIDHWLSLGRCSQGQSLGRSLHISSVAWNLAGRRNLDEFERGHSRDRRDRRPDSLGSSKHRWIFCCWQRRRRGSGTRVQRKGCYDSCALRWQWHAIVFDPHRCCNKRTGSGSSSSGRSESQNWKTREIEKATSYRSNGQGLRFERAAKKKSVVVASSHTFQNASGNPDRNQKAARLPNAETDGKSSEHSLGCRENFAEQRFAGNGSGNTGSDFCLQQYVSCGSSVYWDRFIIKSYLNIRVGVLPNLRVVCSLPRRAGRSLFMLLSSPQTSENDFFVTRLTRAALSIFASLQASSMASSR